MKNQHANDLDLRTIAAVQAGNGTAFRVLVDRYKERGMGLAMRFLRNREEAEEALQDAFVRAYRALPDFEGRSSFGTWFYRILFNVCSARLEVRHDQAVSFDSVEGTMVLQRWSEDPLPDVQFDSTEFESIVKEEVERLPEPFGSTFALFCFRELSYDEIVEVLGAPLGTVKARIFRARAMLRVAVAKRLGHALPQPVGP